MTRIVTVFGATGTQDQCPHNSDTRWKKRNSTSTGSSVVQALLADGTFTPRAVTRNPDSDASKKLIAQGVEIVQADLGDKESVKKAVQGSEAVFGVTQPFDRAAVSGGNTSTEIDQGKNLVDACKEASVQFFIWSTLPSSKIISNGKYSNIHHLDDKFVIQEYLRNSGLPHANVRTGNFAENVYNHHQLNKNPSDPGYILSMPCVPATFRSPLIWIEKDLGPCILALLNNYKVKSKDVLGQTFPIVAEKITYGELATVIGEVLNQPVVYQEAPSSGVDVLDDMFKFYHEYDLFRDTIIPDPRLLAFGVKFSSTRSFVEEAVKPRLS